MKGLRPLAPAMLDAIARVRPGELIRGEGGSDVGVPSGLKDTETLRTKRTGSDQRDPTGRSELARKTAMIRNAPTSSPLTFFDCGSGGCRLDSRHPPHTQSFWTSA